MKTFYFTLFLLVSCIIHGQNPPLDTEILNEPSSFWYLHSLTVNNETYAPNIAEIGFDMRCQYVDPTFTGSGYGFFLPNSDLYTGFDVIYDISEQNFTLIEGVSLTEGICTNTACNNFFAIYEPFYFDTGFNYDYEVVSNGDGTKTLTVEKSNGDVAVYSTEALVLSTNDLSKATVSIAPNPVTNQLTLNLEQDQLSQIRIVNVNGQVISTQNKPDATIDVSHLASGLYFLQLTDDVGRRTQMKFVKK